jgi:hypothetical protein
LLPLASTNYLEREAASNISVAAGYKFFVEHCKLQDTLKPQRIHKSWQANTLCARQSLLECGDGAQLAQRKRSNSRSSCGAV